MSDKRVPEMRFFVPLGNVVSIVVDQGSLMNRDVHMANIVISITHCTTESNTLIGYIRTAIGVHWN